MSPRLNEPSGFASLIDRDRTVGFGARRAIQKRRREGERRCAFPDPVGAVKYPRVMDSPRHQRPRENPLRSFLTQNVLEYLVPHQAHECEPAHCLTQANDKKNPAFSRLNLSPPDRRLTIHPVNTSETFQDGPPLAHAISFLRAERAGELAFAGHVRPIKFVLDNESGRIVAPMMVAAADDPHPVLFLPEESLDAMQLILSPEPMDGETHAAADRWRIHHGREEDIRWMSCYIDSAKWGPMVYDGDALMLSNPLADYEPAACKKMNQDRSLLTQLCERGAGVAVADPVCVALDPEGLHVRARFGVVRIPFAEPAQDAEHAARLIDELIREAQAAGGCES